MLKNFFKHPIWSSVIASGIVYLITFIATTIKSYDEKTSLYDAGMGLLNTEVKLKYILISFISLILLLGILVYITKKKSHGYSRNQKKLMKFDEIRNEQANTLFRYKVYFKQNGDPFISDLEVFCGEHKPPIRFINGRCSIAGCKNNRFNIDLYAINNHIESLVIDYWRRLNKG